MSSSTRVEAAGRNRIPKQLRKAMDMSLKVSERALQILENAPEGSDAHRVYQTLCQKIPLRASQIVWLEKEWLGVSLASRVMNRQWSYLHTDLNRQR